MFVKSRGKRECKLLADSNKSISPLELSRMLNLSIDKVHECLAFLEKVGILIKQKGQFKIQDIRIHIPEGATWLNAHHKFWRNRSILSLDDKQDEDLHYTMIQANEPIIRDAEDRVVYSFNLDFF